MLPLLCVRGASLLYFESGKKVVWKKYRILHTKMCMNHVHSNLYPTLAEGALRGQPRTGISRGACSYDPR